MKTLLCVDDDHWVLETLKDALAPKGLRVLGTTSPEEAPLFLRQVKIDLVLLDLDMPGRDGFAVYREIEKNSNVPVLFVSACTRSFEAGPDDLMSHWQNEYLMGRTDILYKPFTLAELHEKVEALLGEYEMVA